LPELFLTHRARDDLTAFPDAVQQAVLETLEDIRRDPGVAGKQLVGRLRGLWSARVGSYRVLYTIEVSEAAPRVIVRSIRHRAVAYGGG
jgi:mRNA interferase RelE/StbE